MNTITKTRTSSITNTKMIIATSIALVAGGLAFLAIPIGSKPISKCGYTITKSGNYHLTKNIVAPTTGNMLESCISVKASDVTLNCNEKWIVGENSNNVNKAILISPLLNYNFSSTTASSTALASNTVSTSAGTTDIKNVNIKNCNINNFKVNGITINNAVNTSIKNVRINNSGVNLYTEGVGAVYISNSVGTKIDDMISRNTHINNSMYGFHFNNTTKTQGMDFDFKNVTLYLAQSGNKPNSYLSSNFNIKGSVLFVSNSIPAGYNPTIFLTPNNNNESGPVFSGKKKIKGNYLMIGSQYENLRIDTLEQFWKNIDLQQNGQKIFDSKSFEMIAYQYSSSVSSGGQSKIVPTQAYSNSLIAKNIQNQIFVSNIYGEPVCTSPPTVTWQKTVPFGRKLPEKMPTLVILWDPSRPGHAVASVDVMRDMFFGSDPSVSGYFGQLSEKKFQIVDAGMTNWVKAKKPASYYWGPADSEDTNKNGKLDVGEDKNGNGVLDKDLDGNGFIEPHVEKWAEGILEVDKNFDFSRYDTNGDRILQENELGIIFVIPQNSFFGTVRGISGSEYPTLQPLVVDGVKLTNVAEIYWPSTAGKDNLGVMFHELSHLYLGTGDMYMTSINNPYDARSYSLMANDYYNNHLDPFHKMASGWLKPKVISQDGCYEINSMDGSGEAYILYDKTRGDKEYFIIENRQIGQNYDNKLLDTGLAVWHIVEDPQVYGNLSAPPGVNAQDWAKIGKNEFHRRGIRLIRAVTNPISDKTALRDGSDSQTGKDFTLKWYDGTDSGFTIKDISPSAEKMNFFVDVK